MRQKWMLRYLIVVLIVAFCAGIAWYLAEAARTPAAGAVLARIGRMTAGAEVAGWRTRHCI